MKLRCLNGDAELVRAAQKINLGILPVQPPASCYRRAESDILGLSWVAVDGEVVIGAAIADLEIGRDGLRTVQLRTLAVSAQFRRQGIGRQLVLKVVEQGKKITTAEGKVQGVRLNVHVGNNEAIAFYKALGFVKLAQIENYYRHLEPRTALMMEYSL
ncbi:hypothetical protein CCR75_004167 [Bremia lactucae]|uniref:N-acetyltransferase domain-containing protein n=1 Tax=Bremia lactucae TaxID=4779 RepID=A0A976FKG1_BRELC|nr:hypothetical protein CCR75_004167 [Bremia lactucae]